jgi:transcription initiation factor TFIID subunit 2
LFGRADRSCRKYNNFGDPLYAMADATQVTFWQEWPKAVSPRMTPSEKKDMAALLNKAIKDERSMWFRDKGEWASLPTE